MSKILVKNSGFFSIKKLRSQFLAIFGPKIIKFDFVVKLWFAMGPNAGL